MKSELRYLMSPELSFRNRVLHSVPIAFVAIFFICGCGKGHFSQQLPTGDANIMRVAELTNPAQFDPALIQDTYSTDMLQQVYQGLLKWGNDLSIKPCLATSWDIKNGGKTYIFHLRKGVKFFNGDSFTATDVKFSIERACNPALHSTVADEYLGSIIGVDAMCNGKANHVSGVKILDPFTIEIDLKNPISYFLGTFIYNTSWILDHKVAPFNKPILNVNQMVGTGPFIPTKFVEDQEFVMETNPNYWGHKASISGIQYLIVKEPATRIDLFEANKIDLVTISPPEATGIESQPALAKDLKLLPLAGVEYFAMNEKNYKPFANRNIRRAFAMAIDNVQIVNKIGGGIFLPANGILPPLVLGHRDQTDNLPFDPLAARKSLASAGITKPSSLPTLKIFTVSGDLGSQRDGQAIQNQLEHNLGVNIELVPTDFGTILQKEDQNALPSYLLNWFADYPDPQDFLSLMLTTTGEENHTAYSNPEVDKLCAKADLMPEKVPKRLALYAKAEDLILQDAPWKPIGFWRQPALIQPRVHGLVKSIYGYGVMNRVKLSN